MSDRSRLSPENTWVLICTYDRNELLTDLLKSLQRVELPADAAVQHPQVVVVDNAEQPRAKDVVGAIYPEAVYIHQPRPGIATARNTSVQTVPPEAEAVVFVDDDEQVSPGWLSALLDCANTSGADAVTGPVVPNFREGEPDWVRHYGYVRRTDFQTGPHQRRLATNNTLVRWRWFAERRFRFDERFNFTGGSDSDLFERMLKAGAQFWWCAEAVVTEDVPPERSSREWLRRRALRGGRVRAMKRRRRSASGKMSLTAQIVAEGLARAGYGSLRRFGKQVRRHPVTYADEYYLCEGLGMLLSLTGRARDEYQRFV